jgi:hypothetical protein
MRIVLSSVLQGLGIKMGEALATTAPIHVAHYADKTTTTFTPGVHAPTSLTTSYSELVAVPASSTQRIVSSISVFNCDTIAHTVYVAYFVNPTYYEICKQDLPVNATLIIDENGINVVSGAAAPGGYVSKSGNYTVETAYINGTVNFSATATCTLLSAATAGAGNRLTIRNSAASGVITITPAGSETIDGATSNALSAQYSFVTLQSDGTNWIVLDCWDELRAIQSTPQNMVDAQYSTLVSVTLTPGYWTLHGNLNANLNGATVDQAFAVAISAFTNNTTTDHVTGDNVASMTPPLASNGGVACLSGYVKRYTTSGAWSGTSAGTMYLKALANVSAGTPQHFGRLHATRFR